MKNFISTVKSKYVIAALVIVAAAGFAFFRTSTVAHSENCPGAAPTSPVFNYWPLTYDTSATCHDLALIDARNVTNNGSFSQSQSQHDAGVQANTGDTVEVSVYFHNGASDQISRSRTTATNVRFGTNFNTSAQTDHSFSGTLSADNAATVTSTSAHQGGNITIHTGSTPTVAQYVPGSTYMCVTQQAASELGRNDGTCGLTTSGVRINMPDGIANGTVGYPGGSLKACFPYSGTINYQVIFQPAQSSGTTLSITKTVANILKARAQNSVTANSGNSVQYTIVVTDTGSATANNVVVTDPGVNGISGSLGTKNIGNLTSGQSQTLTYTGTVTASSGTLVNTATAVADNAPQVQASATVVVSQPAPINTTLSITKTVKDQTNNNGPATAVSANQGDSVQYTIVVSDTGNTDATNVVVSDPGTNGINGSLGTKNLGTLPVGQSQTFTYTGTVNTSSGSLVNTATATADNASQVQASATVNVAQQITGSITVTKQVKDLTQGNSGWSNSINASQGDRIAYQIVITAQNIAAQNLNSDEQLPQSFQLASGSVTLNGQYVGDSYASGSQNLGTLNAGSSDTIYFEGTVSGGNYNCSSNTLTNTVTVSATNESSQSASATVYIPGQNCQQNAQLSITKMVKNDTYGNYFQKNVNAYPNDRVTFQLSITDVGNTTANNVVMNDQMPNGLSYVNGSMSVNGASNYYNNNNYGYNTSINIGNLGAGQTATITFDATVIGNTGMTIQNIAQASASNANTVQDYATIFVNGQNIGSTNVQLSKSAFNQTQNINATSAPAHANDYIQYTLTVNNSGTAPANNYVIQDDLSNVLTYASVVSPNGGTMNGNVISWPAVTIPAGGNVVETFIVRINIASSLPNAANLQITNTFGNTVTIQVSPGQVLGITYVAPQTGVGTDLALGFALAITAAFALFKNKALLGKLGINIPKIKIR